MPLIRKGKRVSDSNPLRLLSLEEAAEQLGVTRQTLYRWVRQGKCPFPVRRLGSKLIRVRQDVLEKFLREGSELPE